MPMVRRVVGWLGLWAGTGLWVVTLAPALALVPAAVLDRGPGGTARVSLFPLALTVLDPLVWDCVWNSVAVALVVAAGSLALGSGLARVCEHWRFSGRPVLWALTLAPLAVPPLVLALGLRGWAGPWLAARDPQLGTLAAWIGWVWAGLAGGVPLVALATDSALQRFDPGWEDAARLVGASRRRIWWQLVWPVARPAAARAAGIVFTLTLIEPGAPLVLGLRRSLAFQIVDAVQGPDPAARAVLLCLAAVVLSAAVRGLIRLWAGSEPVLREGRGSLSLTVTETAGIGRTAWYVVLLGLGAGLSWVPIAGLLGRAWGVNLLAEPDSLRLIENSLLLGAAVVAIDLALTWTLAAWAGRRHPWVLGLAGWPELLPPLALGVGALGLPPLLRLAADWARATPAKASIAHGVLVLAGSLDPNHLPGLLLAVAVAATRLPFLARTVEAGWSPHRRTLADAAVLLGASPRQSRRVASGHWLGAPSAALVLTFALAATNLAPALVLAPTAESRPLVPGILILADQPGAAFGHAAALAVIAVAVNLAAIALASTRRSIHLGEWFRG
jgi:ABC-type Fe3+ transport system permease subunit